MVTTMRRGMPSLRVLNGGTGNTMLLLLPHAGGNHGSFRRWPSGLPPEVTVLAACYPARLDRLADPPVATVEAMAAEIEADLATLPSGPLVVFGHSMGSFVGVELCERLQRSGRSVSLFVASGSHAPHRHRPRRIVSAGVEAVVADVVRLNPGAGVVLADPDLRELLLPSIVGDYTAVELYARPSPPVLDCDIVVYSGTADPLLDPADGARWAECTRRRFEHHVFDGDHFFTESSLDSVLADLRARLADLSSSKAAA